MCDCRTGEYLCQEAEELWANYTRCYQWGQFDEADRWQKAYYDHKAAQHQLERTLENAPLS